MKLWILLFCLTVILFESAIAQCVSRPPCNMMNEAMMEAPRNIIPQPIAPSFGQGTIMDTPYVGNSIHQVPTGNMLPFPAPTTIITDYSPAICKHLADTLQLMVVCNLLQGNRGSSEMAMKIASPIIREVLTSPTFSRAAMNINSNGMIPNLITPQLNNNFIPPVTNTPLLQAPSQCNKDLLPNILSLLRNLK